MKSDEEMLSLDIGTLVKSYPDLTHEQLMCLLLLRGDMGRNDARDTANEAVPEGNNSKSTLHARSILSQVQVTSSLNPFAAKDGGKEAGGGAGVPKNPFSNN